MLFFTPAHGHDHWGVEPDSVHIYLLTCSPHQEIYSLYGHSALRVENRQSGEDVAVNYGVFDFRKPYFGLRFVFGITDYEMGVCSFEAFKREYMYYGSSVVQQELNLNAVEKLRILAALNENWLPENRVYRYSYFYDNCTTRVRDIVAGNLGDCVVYENKVPEGVTFRKMIHEMNGDYPWARLGNDLLLGVGADRQLDMSEYQFLPHSMLSSADSAYVVDKYGDKRRFVLAKDMVVKPGVQVVGDGFPLTPIQCASVLLAVTLFLSVIEWKTGKYLWLYDVVLEFGLALCSIVMVAMLFSQHPTVNLNAQILLFNPLVLVFGVQAIHDWRAGKLHWLWLVQIVCVCLLLVVYSFGIQWIDMSVRLLALSVLVRCGLKMKGVRGRT
ncbi:MAG: DUF4105 domain-containing protein [Bacteroidales bacterium]|nr:DUF4105 domain-containing protein [Bacteroidales bacterium]MCM1146680.1 DUF4105 domain-containing protein [Bacteroidales bacterium]MCM1205497.1 DUF4105 domain-containing protein [Bacillota bacterium]MCM1509242.1 DUF4105 domain-containing protein [Clostridium sp.]